MGIAIATVSPSNVPTQVGNNDPQGEVLPGLATTPLAFWGGTPVAQPAGPNQAAVPTSGVSSGAGALVQYTSTQSPSSVAVITVAEQSITVTGVLSTDLVIINKPTAQAGLALCAGRVSAANTVKLVFANVTAAILTPTGSEAYLVTTIPTDIQLSATLSPAAVAANTIVEQQFTFAQPSGLAPGMIVQVNKPTTQAGLGVLTARVISNNVLGLTFINATAATITPTASEIYEIVALNGLVAASQLIEFGVNVGTQTGVATITVAEQAVTAAGIQSTDIMVGMTKPTTQAGLGLVSGRVSAANTIQTTFVNPTVATLTPTASEVYGVTIFRPSPAAPMSLLTTATLTPASVAANTTAEQTFTVTGLVSGDAVVAVPNYNISSSSGIGIGGVRASGSNTLAITFVNTTAAAIIPPAGTFTVAQFNQVPATAGGYVQQLVSPLQTVGMSLLNALRAAMVATNFIPGK